jgi:2-phosphosulfolactate phosphatase
MKVIVHFNPVSVDELYFTGKTTVIIDILRATSTIVTALDNGAKEVVPVASIEFAMKVSGGMFGGQTLLGGERNTKKVAGFALGNSPLEYTPEVVGGKTIILFTTNGSKAVVKAKFSENLFICSFLNLQAIADHLLKLDKDLDILCSGRLSTFSIEDTVCAGRLITALMKSSTDIELSDTARASVSLSKSFGKSLIKLLKESEHGKLLLDNGFLEDIKFCSRINTINVIPYFSQNVVKLLEQESEPNDEVKFYKANRDGS